MTLRITAPTPPQLAAEYRKQGWWHQPPLRDGVERIADTDPDRIAVIDNTGTWTYAQFREQIEGAIGTLVDAGVSSGDPVVIVAPNSSNAVAAIYATLRADGSAVVIDRRCGALDLGNAITSSGARVVVIPDALRDKLGVDGHRVTAISLETITSGRRVRDWTELDPSLPRVVIFTSGTTKRSKGVIHTWETMGVAVKNLELCMDFVPGDRPFTSSPIATMTGLSQVFMAIPGGSLLLEDRFDATRSLASIEAHRATCIGGAPIVLEMLFAEYDRQGRTDSALERISLGGTNIPRTVLEVAIDRFGISPTRVYGSSEVPVHTYSHPDDSLEQRLSDDGSPSPGSECRLGEEFLEGHELHVRGPNMFQGYLYDEDNKSAFVDGWFRTGDLVELRGERVKVLGRLKEVAARKGLKISLAEVDDAASALGGGTPGNPREVAAYAVADDETGERVALALRLDGERPTYEQIVESMLSYGLARGKLPEEIVFWDEPLPRNAAGKIVRTRLHEKAGVMPRVLAPRLAAATDA
jgi:acyl-CoA synthetase (AMP-forming)/AMP-acid ligase II